MGFFDDFAGGVRKGMKEESERSAKRQSYSRYRTSLEEERDLKRKLESRSDSRLLQDMKNSYTSDEEKRVIHGILILRGYTKVGNDYRRR